ncbi:MAG: hypothetical protein CL779_01860 [Chloroflexi bacterium]|nr:hypothetical protein [Chloroflexota bacterium]
MYLRKLSLHGFKAFASPQEFDFTSGTTAIIGPNGSGKSNVADAIRWVFGEQSNKNIRAKKTEDVIFIGSDSRRSMGIAEVTVILDNEDRWLPLEFAEVSITRRAHRSGDNEYFINDNKVRQSDVLALMSQANMSQNSYAFVSQGLADRIIELKPLDRRILIEEAANIDQFRKDLVLTKRRIDETRDNILKVDLILKELKPRVKFYERFQKKTAKFNELSKEINILLYYFYDAKLKALHDQKVHLNEMLINNNKEITTNRNNLDNSSKDMSSLELQISNLNSTKENNQAEIDLLISEINKIDKDLAITNQKNSDLKRQNLSLSDDLNNLTKLQSQSVPDDKKVDASLVNKQIKELTIEKNRLIDSITSNDEKIRELIQKRNVSQQNLDKEFDSFDMAKEKLFNCEKLIREIELELSLLDQYYKEAPVDNDNINDLLNQFVNDSSITSKPNILGPLTRLIQVPEKYERAVESALIGFLNAIVVSNANDAELCFEYLKNNDFGSAKLLLLEHTSSSPPLTIMRENGVIGIASKLVSVDREYQKLVDSLLGKTIIVEDLTTAKLVFSRGIGQVVTLDGTLLINEFTYYGGSAKSSGKHFSIQSRLEDLQERLSQETQKIPQLKTDVVKNDKVIDELRKIITNTEHEMSKFDNERKTFNNSLNKINNEISSTNASLGILENGGSISIINNSETTKQLIKEKTGELESIASELNENESIIKAFMNNVETLKSNKKILLSKHQDIINENAEYEKKISACLQSIKDTEQHIQSLENSNFQANTKQEQVSFELNNLLEKIAQDGFSINDDGIINKQFSDLDEDATTVMDKYRLKCSIASWTDLSTDNLESLNTITNDMRMQILKLGSLDQEIEADLINDKNRYDQLIEQTGDLISAEEELQTVIKKLEFSISEKFSETFQMVNDKFNHYFREVFDGGSAELKMISAENKTEQGIEIIVKPPGKRLSNLAALSGGERAMTSVALMFALMSVNPSPICVLDEIDAALDDANVKRFLRILNELSENTQFIVITHNRITVQDAETVYGISMEQDATSTVLSLKIKDLVN